jgi:H+/gluconate symporter-like permease
MTGTLAIVLALALLILLAYRGFSVLLIAPLMAMLAVVMSGVPVLASYTQVFMPSLGGFIVQYFPLFLLGALFGKLMEASGSANALAAAIVARFGEAHAIAAVVLTCAVLTYGGVSLFVVAFAVQPIAAAMFDRARLPPRLVPASIALGAFTFTMTALPGTPAIQNAIPMPHFGTTAFAAPGIGIVASAIMLSLGLAWITRRARRHAGPAAPEGARERPESAAGAAQATPLPPPWIAMLPIVLVVLVNYACATHILPALDWGHLAQPRFGGVEFASVRGMWSILIALAVSITAMLMIHRGRLGAPKAVFGDGADSAMAPAFNTASLVGFGAVIASLPAFEVIRDAVLGIAPGSPLISLSVAVNILAGITGSASGGMSIALQMLGPTYLELGRDAGIHPDLLHRVTAIATGGLDALPHNGAVITLLSVCRATHREAYPDIFVVACAVPIVALVVAVSLGSALGSF